MKSVYHHPALFVTLFLFPLMATAQILVGVRGGPLFSQPTIQASEVTTSSSTRSIKGFSLGGVLQAPMTESLALVFEPGFVRKGLNVVFDPAFGLSEWTTRLDYVELPLLLQLTFIEGPVGPYLTAGSAVAYKLSESSTLSRDAQRSMELPELFARYDVTLIIGGGLSVNVLNPASLQIDGRYSFGLNDIEKTGAAGIHSAEWRIAVGVLVKL